MHLSLPPLTHNHTTLTQATPITPASTHHWHLSVYLSRTSPRLSPRHLTLENSPRHLSRSAHSMQFFRRQRTGRRQQGSSSVCAATAPSSVLPSLAIPGIARTELTQLLQPAYADVGGCWLVHLLTQTFHTKQPHVLPHRLLLNTAHAHTQGPGPPSNSCPSSTIRTTTSPCGA